MNDPVDRELNRANFKLVCEKLDGLDYLPFFGTLLGLTREQDIIATDDDIDFLVNIIHRDEVIERLAASEFIMDFDADANKGPCFLQTTRQIDGVETYADFYFFENVEEQEFIVERWNFSGRWQDPANAIHIPKEILFPIKEQNYLGAKVRMPSKPELCCDFLYGLDWRTPRVKGADYEMMIIDNKPFTFKRTFLRRVVRKLKKIFG